MLFVFALTVLLWFFRSPGFITGWSVLFKGGFIRDGTVATLMATLLFILPDEKPQFLRSSSEIATGLLIF